jgi:hypothetical protein
MNRHTAWATVDLVVHMEDTVATELATEWAMELASVVQCTNLRMTQPPWEPLVLVPRMLFRVVSDTMLLRQVTALK